MRTLLLLALIGCSSSAREAPPHMVPPPEPTPVVATPVPVPDPAPPGLRLPGDVVPKLYHLDLSIDPTASRSSGKVAIDAQIVKSTWVVWLNATGLSIDSATLGGDKARVIPGGEDYIGLTLGRELRPGPLLVNVAFTAPIDREKSRGLYAEKEGTDTYAYTFFEPTDARRAFPCFDEPSYKVPWQLTFHVKADHVALANAPVEREVPEANGMKRVELAVSKPLPSYLVAFVVGPFELVDGGTAGRVNTPIRFIIPKGRGAELGYAKQVTPKVVTALEDYFDMAYPYGKLDVAVVPRFWGTMEHPGIVAMGQPLTLIRADQATRARKERYTNILAHELGHYWFGDYVTLAWWNDGWLNEALGEWLDLIITDAAEPEWKVMDSRIGRATSAMPADEALSTKAIRQPVTTREQIEAAFDGDITYNKGSTVLRMFETYVGREKWRQFIRRYLQAHAWGNATADDMFAAVRADLGADVEAGLRSFIEQPGVPRISAELSCTGSPKLTVRQQRSLPAGVVDPAPKQWTLPVCVRYGDAKSAQRACAMVGAAQADIPLASCPTWTVLNAEGMGYYRSVVDAKAAAAMLAPRSPAKLTTAEKLMLVADLRAAITRDEIAVDRSLALAPLLVKDADDRVALAAFTAGRVNRNGLDDALADKHVRFFVATFKPLATKLGWKRRAGDSDDRQELRDSAMYVAYFDPALAREATKLAMAWLADRSAVDDDMVWDVLAAAGHHGDAALYDKVLAAARAPRDRTEQSRLISALGYFTDRALVDRSLALVLGTEIDLRETKSILFALMSARETRDAVLGFVEQHTDELLHRMRDDEASWFLGALAELPCTQPVYDRIAPLVTPRAKKVGGAEEAVTRGLEKSRQCIANMQRELPALTKFLK